MKIRFPKTLPEYSAWSGGAVAALLLLFFLWAWSGVYSVAASRGHWAAVEWFLHFVMQSSARTHAFAIKEPPLNDENLVLLGAGHFHSECASCHGAPGFPVSVVAQQMLPPPPRLEAEVLRWRDRELFWIVKNGIKYTGMPAFPSLERDDEVWAVVAFLKRLPELDEAGYRTLVFSKSQPIAQSGRDIARTGTAEEGLGSCVRCHGGEGMLPRSNLIPVLHGQSAKYLVGALEDYANGRRQSGIMQPLGAALSEEARKRVAEYYAALSLAELDKASKPSNNSSGHEIAQKGIPEEHVPACVQCHDGGARSDFPLLAGQHAEYLALKLRLWREGLEPRSAKAEIMAPIAKRLTSQQIEDVSRYFSRLPRTEFGKKP